MDAREGEFGEASHDYEDPLNHCRHHTNIYSHSALRKVDGYVRWPVAQCKESLLYVYRIACVYKINY
jgi:hypothetical protein